MPKAINKVLYGSETLIDLTDLTVDQDKLLRGHTAIRADGNKITGTMDQTITYVDGHGEMSLDENDYLQYDDSGSGSAAISVVDTADSHGGTVRTITALDISDTTAVASDVAQGKYFYTAQGVKTAGTGSGGSPSATAHTIYFEFSDETNTTITAYYDDSFISNAITATTPTTYGNKTVTLAELDGVAWYEVSDDIPLNTELVDYTKVTSGYYVDLSGNIVAGDSWEGVTDYIPIDSTMTFTWKMNDWYTLGLYDASKNPVRAYETHTIADSTGNDVATGTLDSSRIPSTAKYVVLTGNPYSLSSNTLSLIRTA